MIEDIRAFISQRLDWITTDEAAEDFESERYYVDHVMDVDLPDYTVFQWLTEYAYRVHNEILCMILGHLIAEQYADPENGQSILACERCCCDWSVLM